jgi:hypothetical protein
MEMKGFGWTRGMQGGIGYPLLVILYHNKWTYVEDSANHGGTICQTCSRENNIPYGYEPQRFGQPKPYGMCCWRSLVEQKCPYKNLLLNELPRISWNQFVDAIKQEGHKPDIVAMSIQGEEK